MQALSQSSLRHRSEKSHFSREPVTPPWKRRAGRAGRSLPGQVIRRPIQRQQSCPCPIALRFTKSRLQPERWGRSCSVKGGRCSFRPSFHPCYAAISRISSPNKKTRLPLKCRLPHCRLDGTRPHALDDCFGPCLAISPENVDCRDLLSTRHLSFKKPRESAIVHVSLRPLPAQKVDFLASPLLGYWLLAIGYFPLGTSHLISPKTPAIPEFSPNPTCPSHQKVDCFPGPLAFGSNFSQIEGRSREPFRG